MELNPRRLLRTPEFRKAPLALLLVSLLLWGAAGWIGREVVNRAGEGFDTAVAGALGALPEGEARRALLQAVVGGAKPEDISQGRTILARYGYDRELSLRRKRLIAPARALLGSLWLAFFPLYVLLPLLVLILIQLPLFRTVGKATETLKRGLEGDPARIEAPSHGGLVSDFLGRLDQLIRKLDSSLERNITVQARLRESLADISHQLKTPLSAVSLYTELLERELHPRGDGAELLRRCREAVARLEKLTRDLLKLTRLEAGSIAFEREAVDLRSLVEACWRELLPLREERSLSIEEGGCGGATVCGDRAWLGEAVGNVLKNAVQQTCSDGRISVSIASNALFQRLIIADDGGGIPAEDLHRVFERFFSRSHAPDMERTGIGLSLAREIVRGSGGELRARNGGDGAEFIFSFYA